MTTMQWLVKLALGAVAGRVPTRVRRGFGAYGLVYAMPVLAILGRPLAEIIASAGCRSRGPRATGASAP